LKNIVNMVNITRSNTVNRDLEHFIEKLLSEKTREVTHKISELETQVKNLTDSNRELVKLLTSEGTRSQFLCSTCGSPGKVTMSENESVGDKEEKKKSDSSVSTVITNVDKANTKNSQIEIIKQQSDLPGKAESWKENPNKSEKGQQKHSKKTEKAKTPQVKKRQRTDFQIKGTDNAQNSVDSTTEDPGFSAPERKIWLHISRCKSDTTIDQVNSHLHKKWPQLAFEVEKLQSKGSNSSFKVSTQYDKELLTLFYTPSNWPEGVVIKQFRFFRRDNSGQF
jgi:hypothetical protein